MSFQSVALTALSATSGVLPWFGPRSRIRSACSGGYGCGGCFWHFEPQNCALSSGRKVPYCASKVGDYLECTQMAPGYWSGWIHVDAGHQGKPSFVSSTEMAYGLGTEVTTRMGPERPYSSSYPALD